MSQLIAAPNLQDTSEATNELLDDLPPYVARGLVYLVAGLVFAAMLFSFVGYVQDVVRAPSSVVPRGRSRPVQAVASGKVTRLGAAEGDLVEKNQVLIYLESDAAEAMLERAREVRGIRDRQLQDLIAAQADAAQIAEARTGAAAARAELVAAQRALDASMIVAPMSGRLTRLELRDVGEAVQSGQRVAEIAPIDEPLVFEARVPGSDIAKLRLGQSVRLKLDAYPHQEYGPLAGHITEIAPDAVMLESGASYYRVMVTPATQLRGFFSRKSIQLRLGLTARAEILTGRRRIIALFFRNLRLD